MATGPPPGNAAEVGKRRTMSARAFDGSMDDRFPTIVLRRGDAHLAVADALETAIRDGQLRQGMRLPTHRALAQRLGVAVSTVTRAYTEAARRGLIQGAVGRGTFVRADGQPAGATWADDAHRVDDAHRLEQLYAPLVQREEAVNLSLNYPLADGAGARLAQSLQRLAATADLDQLARYQLPQGRPAHRAAGARWLQELGVDARTDDVVVVSGGQTALLTIFLAFARAGDTILTEELTWPGVLAVGNAIGVRLEPVALDDEGLVPEAFEAACRMRRPRLLYTMPTLHNPTTATAGTARRRQIARIARAHDVLIVEDDAYGFLAEPRTEPYFQLARDSTLYLTSLSKPIAPALRVGFVAAPRRLMKPLLAAMRATTVMVSPFLAELTATAIESGMASEAAGTQAIAARRRQRLASRLLGPPTAGSVTPALHRWLRLPANLRTASFVAQALANGVAVTPGGTFAVSPGHDPGGVRLCLCAEPDEQRLAHALAVLARLLHADDGTTLPVV